MPKTSSNLFSELISNLPNLTIILEMEDLPEVLLDEREIRQLILNLVRNGLEAMSSDGTITIRTYTEGDNVVLSIEDQGYGIEPEVLVRLGTPFFTTKEQGTGLGLTVCYGIAKRHNATINIDTSPNGTGIYVYFPQLVFY
jgi:signal transduction histidine kinase